jgi:hypothetical protein
MPDVSSGQKKRLSRIRRRAIPAVREAYEKGLISARRADDLLYLQKRQQAKQLAAILNERKNRERTARLAAEAINSYLASNSGKVDLMELGRRIRAAIA